jgi:hypothetical protein
MADPADTMTGDNPDLDSRETDRFVCDLSALDVPQQQRRLLLAQLLQVGTVEIVELPDGYAFHIDPASIIAQHLEEFVGLEGRCCPFLNMAIRTGTVGPYCVLEMRGGDCKSFIAGQFGISQRPRS